MRHASFFSGVGGLDLGFEKAGIKTVSVCEIDPYASSVLAERFPDAPNLGSITEVNADDIPEADIWSGGFPCQDLSTAGKRAGFAGKRSSLAFTFLDLVEQRRPRWILLENVPGLFTSNKGADFARLLHEMEQLGYSVAWRTLDARYFGVPQRRRRVFIVASLEPDRAAEVLFECKGCERHPTTRKSSWQDASDSIAGSIGINRIGESEQSGSSFDANGMREADGMARRMDDQPISFPSRYSRQPTKFNHQTDPLTLAAGAPAVFMKSLETRVAEDPLLPPGLDSHRYRCCGNGVVANVAEWIGHRIMAADQEYQHNRMLAAMDDFSDRAEGLEIPYRDD
jgi:DNA (cytosine-5)-methyltransferase 1